MVLGGFRSFHVLVTTSLGIQKGQKIAPSPSDFFN